MSSKKEGGTHSNLNYDKWADMWVSSDDDEDCHPNIDKFAWRRLKQRMRAEKGIEVAEPELKDKWNTTNVNKAVDEIELPKTNPEQYLKEKRPIIDKFANIKNRVKSDGFLMANPTLATQLTEGYLITKAVDLAVVNKEDPKIQLYAERCLQVHNLNESAKHANIQPQVSVPLFYKQLKNDAKRKEYDLEFKKQLKEILGRIETRRIERLEEDEKKEENPEEDFEKAPLGPGGLDPTEVLQSLPENIQDAFCNQNKELLVKAFESLSKEEAEYHLKRCVDAGLWNENPEEPPKKARIE